ncbi:hypothetical protein OUZ56_006312 [Daphnia magna]|uniref:Uncharacterized protein n=1 Tax=Daphnia magna TaxID=35525 RepID=A0ABQ9YV98_9CRUS|nr:hypothetical protein OUZ56_006312 [Daphnia magna]
MSHTKQRALLFSMLLSTVVAQYGSAPLPPQLHPVHLPPPPLFGGQTPKKQQHKPFAPSVPIFKPSAGLGPLPVPSGLGPLPVSSGLGPLPLPAGQMSGPSYSYGSQSNGLPSSFQQLPQPSFQSQRPWQPAPSFSSIPAPQMSFAPFAMQQGVPQSYAVPSIYLQQPTASFGSVPSKFLSPPPPPSFPAPVQFGVLAGNPVMQPSFPVAQPNQYTQSMPTYGNGPSMMQMQQNPESFSFGNIPQRELTSNGQSAQSYGPSQFGPSAPSSYGSVEIPQQFQVSSMSAQSFGPVSSPQSFAIPAPQQSFSPSESSQSYSPAQSYQTSQSSTSVEPQFAPIESQQTFGPSSSSQSFAVASSAQSYAPSNGGLSQVEGPSIHDMQVPIFGIPPPSQQQGSSEYQQSQSQVSSNPVRQESYPEHLLPMLYQSAAALASAQHQPGFEPAGPSSGSPYDGTMFTRHVRLSDTFPSA